MKLFQLSDEARSRVTSEFDRHLLDLGLNPIGGSREDPTARSPVTLQEATIPLDGIPDFLEARGEELDRYFTRTRTVLFGPGGPVGSMILDDVMAIESGTGHALIELGGAEPLVAALADAESREAEKTTPRDPEPRLVRMPQIYLSALLLVGEDGEEQYQVLSPPYQEHQTPKSAEEFAAFVEELLAEHRKIFGTE